MTKKKQTKKKQKKKQQLEIVFIKHYTLNHMLASKDNLTRKKSLIFSLIKNAQNDKGPLLKKYFFRIYSKVNQVIYSSLPINISNFKALASIVFEIFY